MYMQQKQSYCDFYLSSFTLSLSLITVQIPQIQFINLNFCYKYININVLNIQYLTKN